MRLAASVTATPTAPKKRGRPKGSTNRQAKPNAKLLSKKLESALESLSKTAPPIPDLKTKVRGSSFKTARQKANLIAMITQDFLSDKPLFEGNPNIDEGAPIEALVDQIEKIISAKSVRVSTTMTF